MHQSYRIILLLCLLCLMVACRQQSGMKIPSDELVDNPDCSTRGDRAIVQTVLDQWDNHNLSVNDIAAFSVVGNDGTRCITEFHVPGYRLSIPLDGPIPVELGQLTQLRVLNLFGNELTSVPAELGQLSQLEELNLSMNELTSVPAELGQLSQLRVLNLFVNELTSVPAELGQLSQLRVLNLFVNELTSVPAEIGQLTELEGLGLSGNELRSVPAELGQLSGLRGLDLSENNLSGPLPPELKQLSNLRRLSLEGNDGLCIPTTMVDAVWFDESMACE